MARSKFGMRGSYQGAASAVPSSSTTLDGFLAAGGWAATPRRLKPAHAFDAWRHA
jgi:hypothetical protein